MNSRKAKTGPRAIVCLTLIAIFLLVTWQGSRAQSLTTARDREAIVSALAKWISLDAPPGWEHLATDRLAKVLPGWTKDRAGNLMLRKGSGAPRRVIACGLDRSSFVVTEITDDGYLRLRQAGSLRQHPLWTQFHEGQRIKVLTGEASVPGVVAVKSTHLQQGRPVAPLTTIDDLWVDIGARSKSEVERMGIELLDPVVRDFPAWFFGNFVSGPAAGNRVGCAAVASASLGEVENGETVFLLTTLRGFGNDGLEAALRKLGRID